MASPAELRRARRAERRIIWNFGELPGLWYRFYRMRQRARHQGNEGRHNEYRAVCRCILRQIRAIIWPAERRQPVPGPDPFLHEDHAIRQPSFFTVWAAFDVLER